MIKVASVFAQVLSLVDHPKFSLSVAKLGAEKGAKGFRCWEQFVCMLFCHLAGANSLREICGGLASSAGRMVHLGIKRMPKRSTLSYANNHRPWQVFESTFYELLGQADLLAAKQRRRFRFKNPLVSIDSATIDLCLSMFDWAKFRRAKGAVKLHLMLNHQGHLPGWALVTDGKMADVKVAQKLEFAPETLVAMDRGYVDYDMFERWTARRVWFVTRAKKNMKYLFVQYNEVPERSNLIADDIIELVDKPGLRLRRVVVWDKENLRPIVLLTNHMKFAASTIAAIYKERWQIELFFKAIKQNLKIKTFVGTSENAVKIQIWTALISILLLKILQMRSRIGWSLSNLAAMLRFNLLSYTLIPAIQHCLAASFLRQSPVVNHLKM
ncbi:Transposase [Anaerohalosphaera lusitana]|uniref:Transposase n=1 Tax=Anaerohalosphaera lusitana TaxID=1936003 RepID=A0A1U9NMF4_9BACT|nr:IS4 family transposase [Anaerohalosphaera lusitana]AQT68770.1 Transposase [Anaerohalosphaera lusitana]